MNNLQHSQVYRSNDDTCAPEINPQAHTKPKFFIFCRWVLCHFAHNKHTNALIRLESIQQIQLRQKWQIIIATSKVSPIEKQRRKRHAKPKFYILRRWVLCHFADEKLTKA